MFHIFHVKFRLYLVYRLWCKKLCVIDKMCVSISWNKCFDILKGNFLKFSNAVINKYMNPKCLNIDKSHFMLDYIIVGILDNIRISIYMYLTLLRSFLHFCLNYIFLIKKDIFTVWPNYEKCLMCTSSFQLYVKRLLETLQILFFWLIWGQDWSIKIRRS